MDKKKLIKNVVLTVASFGVSAVVSSMVKTNTPIPDKMVNKIIRTIGVYGVSLATAGWVDSKLDIAYDEFAEKIEDFIKQLNS